MYRSGETAGARSSPWATGLVLFAAVFMVVGGSFHAIQGLAALINDDFFESVQGYAYDIDVTTWGWMHLIVGIIVALTGLTLLSGAIWARIIALFIMVVSVANSRFLSDAIDPLAQKETVAQTVNGRVTDNTLQQNFLFLVATLALSTVLSEARLQVIPAMTIVFVIARIVFWIGYRLDPLLRAPGMSATVYLNLGGLLAAAYLAFVAT